MYALIGEDKSDADTIKVLIKRLANNERMTIKTKGYSGCGEMLRKGARDLKLFESLGCTHFVVSYDADNHDPQARKDEVIQKVVKPSGINNHVCVVIPVQELEAWLLADIEAASAIFKGWQPKPVKNPELISEPKEYLEKLSRQSNKKPRYVHAIHNEKMAWKVDLDKVQQKCKSFHPLMAMVAGSHN